MFATSTKRETRTVHDERFFFFWQVVRDERITDTNFFFLPQFKGQNKVTGRLRWLGRISVPTSQGDVRVY